MGNSLRVYRTGTVKAIDKNNAKKLPCRSKINIPYLFFMKGWKARSMLLEPWKSALINIVDAWCEF